MCFLAYLLFSLAVGLILRWVCDDITSNNNDDYELNYQDDYDIGLCYDVDLDNDMISDISHHNVVINNELMVVYDCDRYNYRSTNHHIQTNEFNDHMEMELIKNNGQQVCLILPIFDIMAVIIKNDRFTIVRSIIDNFYSTMIIDHELNAVRLNNNQQSLFDEFLALTSHREDDTLRYDHDQFYLNELYRGYYIDHLSYDKFQSWVHNYDESKYIRYVVPIDSDY